MTLAKASLFALLAFAALLSACGPATPSPTPSPTAAPSDPVARLCLQGVRQAIDLEIANYQNWLANADPAQQAMYQQALDFLQRERQRYQSLSPSAFRLEEAWRYIPGVKIGVYGQAPLPPPKPIVLDDAWIAGSQPAQVLFSGQTRSGPFYLVVAVAEGLSLTPGTHYRLTLQPVMPQSYPFFSAYVCVLDAEAQPAP